MGSRHWHRTLPGAHTVLHHWARHITWLFAAVNCLWSLRFDREGSREEPGEGTPCFLQGGAQPTCGREVTFSKPNTRALVASQSVSRRRRRALLRSASPFCFTTQRQKCTQRLQAAATALTRNVLVVPWDSALDPTLMLLLPGKEEHRWGIKRSSERQSHGSSSLGVCCKLALKPSASGEGQHLTPCHQLLRLCSS